MASQLLRELKRFGYAFSASKNNCFLEIHVSFNSLYGRCSAHCNQAWDRLRDKSRVRGFLTEGYFLFENKTYGKSISSGKSLARLPVKTFHESWLAPEKLSLKVRTFKNIGIVYEFVQFKAWERKITKSSYSPPKQNQPSSLLSKILDNHFSGCDLQAKEVGFVKRFQTWIWNSFYSFVNVWFSG